MRTLASDVEDNADHIFNNSQAAMHWNAVSGLTSEVGEISEIFKKAYFHGHPWTDETTIHLKKELGDLLWYVMLMCYANNYNPAEILQINIDKLKARYPEGFETQRSINRAEDDI
jgi:NTP pyrophosphatase (non-canonical NTP hydrolase)